MFPRRVREGVRRSMGCRAWTTGEADERSQVVPRTPKLESDLRPTCASGRARMAEEAKPKHKRTSVGKTRFFCFRNAFCLEPVAFSALGFGSAERTFSLRSRCAEHTFRFALMLGAMRRTPPSAPPWWS